ncbi:T6SS phospholipase effector Tle1-like catalytic domain-containing protein [Malaciobacter marinus]|uniref:T6SS phospholipase effector Tle1-like catalytic domain-containing protein n=1 Tax=Malaciobacter marinus TaxID=505249 RepID=UPI003AFFA49D
MSNDITKGNAFHKEGEVVHLNEFCTKENEAIEEDIKTRIAYMVISNEDIKELLNSTDDKQIILDKVIEEYKPYLIKAVKKESTENNKPLIFDDLRGITEQIVDKKLVKLCTSQLYNSKSYGSVLKAKKYHHAYKKVLQKNLKENLEKKSTSALTFTKDSCNEIIKKEVNKTSKKPNEDEQAYIVLSMPYVYNIKDGSKTKELELISYEDKIIASFMPELIVEYGVFFDGTNNNIYNIDFYKNFVEFLKEPAKDIEDGLNENDEFGKPKAKTLDEETIQYYLLSIDNPEFTKKTKKIIINQMNNASKELRYFDSKSVFIVGKDEILTTKKAEKDSKKVFDYLLDVKNSKKDAQEKTISDYIIKEILPDDNEDSSFTNGETNISRLYELYDGDDVKKNKDALPNTRFKLYESGSGTFNPFIQKDYEDDSVVGLGLGMGESGVIAHCLYSCIKMVEQLRKDSITHIDELVLDVFGFSRGSTSARHFICTLLKNTQLVKNEKREYTIKTKDSKDIFYEFFGSNGYVRIGSKTIFNPLRTDIEYINPNNNNHRVYNPFYKEKEITIESISFRFAGLFDTVTHYGIMQSNDSDDLNINFFENDNNKKVGHVVHLMADDEFRYNFEAYSIFTNINKHYYKESTEKREDGGARFEEFYVPGAHADVGGGYNEENELVYLGDFIIEEKKLPDYLRKNIQKWNNKYNWLKNNALIQKDSKKEIKKLKEETKEKEGFYYYIKNQYKLNPRKDIWGNSSNWEYHLHLYMYKPKVSNKYEHVAMRLMYDKAIYVDSKTQKNRKDEFEMVPFGKFDHSFKDDETLKKTYKALKEHKVLKKENTKIYKELKNNYLHHSSQVGNFVNKPSNEKKDEYELYGKRVIYSTKGKEFTRG